MKPHPTTTHYYFVPVCVTILKIQETKSEKNPENQLKIC